MITEAEKETILRCVTKYDISSLYLFGSAAEKGSNYHDIDLGVKGLRPDYFFKFYADLFRSLTKSVDLVDLSNTSRFNSLIEKEGLMIYGKSTR